MGTRGRKSSAELATVSPAGISLTRRPEPPAHLGDDAAEIWRATVNSLPADWFSPGTLPLLEAFCGLSVSQQLTLRALQRAERSVGNEFDIDEWATLQKQLGEISGRVATLATRMRLTPQSRYGARAADTAARASSSAARLWDQ
jgi:phage terminase small subunit